MTTYNKLCNTYPYLDSKAEKIFLAAQDAPTLRAWKVIEVLHRRKGFDWWFEDLDTSLQNSIFNELCKAVK